MKYKLFSQLWDEIDVRDYRRGNTKMDNPEKLVTQDTQDTEKKHRNIRWTPLHTNNHKQRTISRKRRTEHRFYVKMVADITTRNSEL